MSWNNEDEWMSEEKLWRQWLKENDDLILPTQASYWQNQADKIMQKIAHVQVQPAQPPRGKGKKTFASTRAD